MSGPHKHNQDNQEIAFKEISPIIGAEVSGINLADQQDKKSINILRSALLKYKVLVFRNQELSDDNQIMFTQYFGDITPAHPITNGLPDRQEVKHISINHSLIRNRTDVFDLTNPLGSRGRPQSASGWHIDITFVANPNSVTVLRSVDVPSVGGDTLYVDMEALYQSFSPSVQAFLDTLQVVHARDDAMRGRPPVARFDGRAPGPFASLHPLVRIHPATGKKVLFHSPNFAVAVVGLHQRESNALLEYLDREVDSRADLQLRLRWEKNTVVAWDNSALAHVGPIGAEFIEGLRVLHRTTAAGELPRGVNGFVSKPLVGDLFTSM